MRFESLSEEEPADPGVVPMTSLNAPTARALGHDEHSLQIAAENLNKVLLLCIERGCIDGCLRAES